MIQYYTESSVNYHRVEDNYKQYLALNSNFLPIAFIQSSSQGNFKKVLKWPRPSSPLKLPMKKNWWSRFLIANDALLLKFHCITSYENTLVLETFDIKSIQKILPNRRFLSLFVKLAGKAGTEGPNELIGRNCGTSTGTSVLPNAELNTLSASPLFQESGKLIEFWLKSKYLNIFKTIDYAFSSFYSTFKNK